MGTIGSLLIKLNNLTILHHRYTNYNAILTMRTYFLAYFLDHSVRLAQGRF